jgi:hypothetical protein
MTTIDPCLEIQCQINMLKQENYVRMFERMVFVKNGYNNPNYEKDLDNLDKASEECQSKIDALNKRCMSLQRMYEGLLRHWKIL